MASSRTVSIYDQAINRLSTGVTNNSEIVGVYLKKLI
jgi:hypothetical protein